MVASRRWPGRVTLVSRLSCTTSSQQSHVVTARPPRKRRVGVVGYGSLGKYLVKAILTDAKVSARLELAFVWNRTFAKVAGDSSIPEKCKLENLDDFAASKPDLIVEVAHPLITKEYGARFLAVADYMPGSPTALADRACEAA